MRDEIIETLKILYEKLEVCSEADKSFYQEQIDFYESILENHV